MKTIIFSFVAVACTVFFTLCHAGGVSYSAGHDSVHDSIPASDSIRLIFVGDVMGHSPQTKGAWHDGGDSCYNFIPNFQWVKDYISSADIAIANFEVTLAGEPYSGYPTFSSPISLAVVLQDVGFDILATANNHILDHGAKGMERTIDVLDSLGITHTGTFKDSTQWGKNYPLMIEKNGFRLAFLNYTYGTNMGKEQSPVIVNYMDTIRMAADLEKARELNANCIITILHWGTEYQNKESDIQRQIADFLAQHGCNLIVGAHPHVVQPVKKIAGNSSDSVLVAYSLGNFVSNQRWRHSDGGIMLEVTLSGSSDSILKLNSWRYEPVWVHRYSEKGVLVYRLIPVTDYLINPERYPVMSAGDEKLLRQFDEDTRKIMNDE